MLAYVLALVVGLGSFALYMAAFFFPEVHRKHDFIWSGVGLFYALVLWVCAGRITGGVLLGQTASVALLGWFGWQTLTLRRQISPLEQQTALPSDMEWQSALSNVSSSKTWAQVLAWASPQLTKLKAWIDALVTTATKTTRAPVPAVAPPPYVPLTPADFAEANRRPEPLVKPEAQTVTAQRVEGTLQTGASPLGSIAGAFKGLTTKRESKPVYVRKQFRTPEAEPSLTNVAVSETEGSDRVPESIPPEPPKAEIVEAAIVEPEQTELPVPPPLTVDAEVAPDTDPPQPHQ